MKLQKVSLPVVKQGQFDWTVTQTFLRLGRDKVTVTGWGITRQGAWKRFYQELKEEENYTDFDPLKGICEILWTLAGWIDKFTG